MRMLLVFVTVLVLIATLGISAWVALREVEEVSADAGAITEIHEIAAAIDGDLQELGTALNGFAVKPGSELTQPIEASLAHLEIELHELEEELTHDFAIQVDTDLDALGARIRQLGSEIRVMAADPPDNTRESAGPLFVELAELQGEAHEFYEESEHWTAEALASQASVVSRLATELLLVGLAVLAVVAAAWVLVSRSLRRIENMTEVAISIAGGELDRDVEEVRRDEIGVLAGAFNSMTGQLRELISNLESRVAERTSELSAMNDALSEEVAERERAERELEGYAAKLERSNASLQEFAYVASHDLQEPLRKIRSFGGRLQTGYRSEIDERGRDYLDRMLNAASRMQDLIEGLLTYSRVTSRADAFEPVDLNLIAEGVVSDLEVRLRETGGVVEINQLPVIDADTVQMRQLLQNLIANALKFSKPSTRPVVTISAQRVGGGPGEPPAWDISVADNGIGFDQKYAERIFGVFQRLHGRGEYEGTGIGLAACAKIAERHGGSIEAVGRPDEGATFTVRLPSRQSTTSKETEWQAPARSAS